MFYKSIHSILYRWNFLELNQLQFKIILISGTYNTLVSMPSKINEVTTLTACLTDPTSSACTAQYGGTGTLPTIVNGMWNSYIKMNLASRIIMWYMGRCCDWHIYHQAMLYWSQLQFMFRWSNNCHSIQYNIPSKCVYRDIQHSRVNT